MNERRPALTSRERSARWRERHDIRSLDLPRRIVERLQAAAQAAGHPSPAALLLAKLPEIEGR